MENLRRGLLHYVASLLSDYINCFHRSCEISDAKCTDARSYLLTDLGTRGSLRCEQPLRVPLQLGSCHRTATPRFMSTLCAGKARRMLWAVPLARDHPRFILSGGCYT